MEKMGVRKSINLSILSLSFCLFCVYITTTQNILISNNYESCADNRILNRIHQWGISEKLIA